MIVSGCGEVLLLGTKDPRKGVTSQHGIRSPGRGLHPGEAPQHSSSGVRVALAWIGRQYHTCSAVSVNE